MSSARRMPSPDLDASRSQMALRSLTRGFEYSSTNEIRRCSASSRSAGLLVARKTRPRWRSISWSKARKRRSDEEPESRDRKSDSHSSKKRIALAMSASRKSPRRSASTSSTAALPRRDAKSTCKTRFSSDAASACTDKVLPVPGAPHSKTMKPAPYGSSKAPSSSSKRSPSFKNAWHSVRSLRFVSSGRTTSSSDTLGAKSSDPSTNSDSSVSKPTTKSRTRRSSSTRLSVRSADPEACHRGDCTRRTPRLTRRDVL
mmetsp:Transcript_12315/g.37191  ORF Transcript_12315/g.37191 Transcript_12315/m.37191 type:complete len:258 (+) Transcript_12315:2518-3291(+)